jgi:opacity protein-like surface antigen
MKRAAIVFIAVLLMLTGTAFAANRGPSFEGFLGMGTEPVNDIGIGYGLGFGFNLPFNDVFNVSNPGSVKNLMLRADITYYHWEDEVTVGPLTVDVEATRVPVFLGVRYFIPTGVIKAQKLGLFVEGGFELSFDGADTPDDEVNFGFPVGFGMQYQVNPNTYLGLSGRLHLISDSYFSLVGTVGFGI